MSAEDEELHVDREVSRAQRDAAGWANAIVISSDEDEAPALAVAHKKTPSAGPSSSTAAGKRPASSREQDVKPDVKHLKANVKTYLNYYGAEFGDAGAREIAAPLRYNTACAELNLADNMIGDKGVAELSEALRHNQTLTALRLDGNTFGDKGAGSLAEAMRGNKRLLQLSLDSTRVSQAGLNKIRAALADNDRKSGSVRGVRSISASAHDSLIYNCKYEQNEGYVGSGTPSSYC